MRNTRKVRASEYIEEPGKRGYKEGLAVAISILAEKKDVETIIELLKDTNNGQSRTFILEKLLRFKKDSSLDSYIQELKNDKELKNFIDSKIK